MPLFCKTCHNLLSVITTPNNFTFSCNRCKETYEASDKDTMRYEKIKGTNMVVYDTLLENANKDPANPKAFRKCPQCKNNIARQVRLGKDMQLINSCVKCNKVWTDRSD